ncbi:MULTISPECIES: MaoC/PaaZ C-terminal domain-containing protein [Hyphobacterium]|uniref:MaoC/PaaZ C-terminal domain-containing protein n=1 Tax=Hyphobacterium vulgare TaxID=1736751 RepID=A0ABV7A191_9PROT
MTSVSLDRAFTQAELDAFAKLSGDDNPIHVDPDFSARTRFGKTVAHGALLCSVLRALCEQLAPGWRQARQDVMFPAPAHAGETVTFNAEIVEDDEDRKIITLKATKTGETVVEGRAEMVK